MGVDLSSSSIPQMGVVPGQPQSGKAKELAKSLTHGVELQDKKKKNQKEESSVHFRLRKVLVILFIFSQAALYLAAAVLVGEIVCNHENLISAQIC